MCLLCIPWILLSMIWPQDSATHHLQIDVTGIDQLQGSIRVCLMTENEDFLKECKFDQSMAVVSAATQIIFADIPPGTYCISLFHDLDDDETLASEGLFGMPSEPFGFSNNPSMFFGPPSWKRCSFDLNKDLKIQIKLR